MKLRQERYKPKKRRNPMLTALMALMTVMLAVMWLNKSRFGLDTGDMLIATEVEIADGDNFETLHDKMAAAGAENLVKTSV